MAVLHDSINIDAVNAFRGKVDIYAWRGKIVARRWPSPPRYPPTPGTLHTRSNLAAAMALFKKQNQVFKTLYARIFPPVNHDWMDILRRAYILQATANILEQPPVPVAISTAHFAGPARTIATLYVWPWPIWNPATINIKAVPYDTTPPPWRYVPRPIHRGRERPWKPDWALDVLPFIDPSSAVWDDLTKTLTVTCMTDLPQLSITAWPGAIPDPTPPDANQYPLSPAYPTSIFPAVPEAVWPPAPGANIADYTHWLAEL